MRSQRTPVGALPRPIVELSRLLKTAGVPAILPITGLNGALFTAYSVSK